MEPTPLRPFRRLLLFVAMGLTGSTAVPGQASAEDGEWTMAAKDCANRRFSGLEEITAENVNRLRVAWTFSTGLLRGHEAAPLVVGTRCTW